MDTNTDPRVAEEKAKELAEQTRLMLATFGTVTGLVRSGRIVFNASDIPMTDLTRVSVKPFSSGRYIVERLLIQNRATDNTGTVLTATNRIVIGDENSEQYELAQGSSVELRWVDLSKVRVGYIGTQIVTPNTLQVAFFAHGRVMK